MATPHGVININLDLGKSAGMREPDHRADRVAIKGKMRNVLNFPIERGAVEKFTDR